MKSIQLSNFKVFQKPTSFDLAPITILTGKNSSGKSSLIRSFLLLSDYLDPESNQLKLDLGGNRASKHKINTFENLKNWSSNTSHVKISYVIDDYTFELEFSGFSDDNYADLERLIIYLKPIDESLVLDNSLGYCELSVSQRFIDFTTKSKADKSLLTDQDDYTKEYATVKDQIKKISARIKQGSSAGSGGRVGVRGVRGGGGAGMGQYSDESLVELVEKKHRLEMRLMLLKSAINSKSNRELGINFQSEINAESISNPTIANVIKAALLEYVENDESFNFSNQEERRFLLKFAEQLEQFMSFDAHYLGPNRTFQSRLYMNDGSTNEINKIIEDYARHQPSKGSETDLFLKGWLNKFEIGEAVEVESIEGMANKVEIVKDGRRINLADLGFGAGQLLTILLHITTIIEKRLAIPTVKNDSVMILIEEPEANLHPKLQSRLADFFVAATQKYDLQFILETHSEYLIRKLQLLVATDFIGSDQAVVYYLDCDNNSNSIVTISDDSQSKGESVVREEQSPYFSKSGCSANKIEFLSDGKLSDSFGSGFFDEADEQALQLHRFQRQKLRKS
jgi:predicted ATPase